MDEESSNFGDRLRQLARTRAHIGYDRTATKTRVLAALRRAEAGPTTTESHITFESWRGAAKHVGRSLIGMRDFILKCILKP